MGCAFDTKGVPYVIKTSAPSGTDNAYTPPYLWLDTTADKWYLLTDVTAGTATWEAMSDKVPHSLATAENDFLVGKAGGGEWIKKTLAETKTILEIVDPLVYKGVIDCSASPNYPAADAGYVYFVSVAGKIGGASGTSVDAGDKLVCKTDSSAAGDQATVGANWGIVQGNLVYETDTGEIKMNGTVSVGTSVKVPRADHVHASDTTKADKVSGATAGNLAGLDAAGNLTDSGVAADDLLTVKINDIGIPGQMAFGVGVCPESDATLLATYGITPMDGCRIPGHDNYGNYITDSGSIIVWVPKFFYRFSNPENPTFAKQATLKAITGLTQANPGVLTIASHGIPAGTTTARIRLSAMTGMDEANGNTYTCTYVDANTVSIGVDTSGFTAYTSGGWAEIYGNDVDIKGTQDYATEVAANADGYALHRAFIDGGAEKDGFFLDKYLASKLVWGTGYVAASVKNGNPISMHADHNPIADLTACSVNQYYEAINAAHARDGVDGAVNASSRWFCASIFQYGALAMISLAHGQAANGTAHCAWWNATHNYPKGCNSNALKDQDDATVVYQSDGYSNCGKTGSGALFAKTTHNGQNCGVADMSGPMWRIAIGMTCVATSPAIEAMSQASPCVLTVTGHGLTTGDFIQVNSITQADWSGCSDKMWAVTVVDPDTFSIAFDASGFGTPYDAGTDPGTITKGTFYVAKEATAMKDFTSGATLATDHWGATGVAAMMDEINMPFVSAGAFAQRMGNGVNQALSEDTSGDGRLLACAGLPASADGVSATGVDLFGKDYFYQYIRNQLCVLCCGLWSSGSGAGVWNRSLNVYRTNSSNNVGVAAACYLD